MSRELEGKPNFAGRFSIVDVGGGHGVLLETVLCANPGMRGVLFDRPQAIAGARAFVEQAGLAHRCELVSGDFFESLPAGADVYLLKNIIHDCQYIFGQNFMVDPGIAFGDVGIGGRGR